MIEDIELVGGPHDGHRVTLKEQVDNFVMPIIPKLDWTADKVPASTNFGYDRYSRTDRIDEFGRTLFEYRP
jgi:hypothetical protein